MKTLLIDSNGLGFQVGFTLQGLEDDRVLTGVLYGFMKNILSLSKRFDTNRFVFFWDSRKNLRKLIFPEYKIKRTENEELIRIKEICHPQFKLLRTHILPECGFTNVFMQTGFESDDLIAKVVHDNEMLQKPKTLVIVSGDEDLYQLLTPNCSMWIPRKKVLYTHEDFRENYGIAPAQWASVKALGGCKSDEVPGIPGVGEGSAVKFLKGELPKTSSYYKRIMEGKEQEMFCRRLVELPFEGTLPCKLGMDELDFQAFRKICNEYGFRSFIQNKEEWKEEIFERSKQERLI